MVLHYIYKNHTYTVEARWTSQEGKSTIFWEIISHLETIHGSIFATRQDQAKRLDLAVDKLYEQIYRFGEEYQAIPMTPSTESGFWQPMGRSAPFPKYKKPVKKPLPLRSCSAKCWISCKKWWRSTCWTMLTRASAATAGSILRNGWKLHRKALHPANLNRC